MVRTLHVDGNLLMQSDRWREFRFKTVNISGATVAGSVSMIGASFDGHVVRWPVKGRRPSTRGMADR